MKMEYWPRMQIFLSMTHAVKRCSRDVSRQSLSFSLALFIVALVNWRSGKTLKECYMLNSPV